MSLDMDQFVQRLEGVETLNVCVQGSIAGCAAWANPDRWFNLVEDGANAVRQTQDEGREELEELFEKILEWTGEAFPAPGRPSHPMPMEPIRV
jgi:hypothetical protein